jgi:branched-chain amino acid transport system substrate-binding protein
MRTYVGFNLWAEGVRKANTVDRMKVIEALASGIVHNGPPGKTIVDGQTNHVTLDVYLAECQNHGFKVLQHFPNQPPADTQMVCNLIKNPNTDKQFVIDVNL